MKETYASLLLAPIILFLIFFGVFSKVYALQQQSVDNITFSYTQTIAKKGEVNNTIIHNMFQELDKFGHYDAYITVKRFNQDGSVTVLKDGAIFGQNLREQGFDIVTIDVLYRERVAFGYFLNFSVFNSPTSKSSDLRLAATATAFIK